MICEYLEIKKWLFRDSLVLLKKKINKWYFFFFRIILLVKLRNVIDEIYLNFSNVFKLWNCYRRGEK